MKRIRQEDLKPVKHDEAEKLRLCHVYLSKLNDICYNLSRRSTQD